MTLRESERAIGEVADRIQTKWLNVNDQRVRAACGDVDLVATFVLGSIALSDLDRPISDAVRTDERYVAAFERIRATVTGFDSCLVALGKSQHRERLTVKLARLSDSLRQDLAAAVDVFVTIVVERAGDDPIHEKARESAMDTARKVRTELGARTFGIEGEQELTASQEAAGAAAAEKLGTYYEEYAKRESKRADRLRWAVAVLLVLITGMAFVINFRVGGLSLGAELLRLSVTIPMAALATYLARESTRHRSSAKWAGELSIEMRSLPDYVKSLGESGIELRRAFGMRVFGTAADKSDSTGEDPWTPLPEQILELLKRIWELIDRRESLRS